MPTVVAICIGLDGTGVVRLRFDIAEIGCRRSGPSGGLGSGNSVIALDCSRRPGFGRCLAETSLPTCCLGCFRGSGQTREAESASV